MGDKDAPQAPQLPKGVPDGLRKFIECTKDDVTLKDGPLTWLSISGKDLIPADMAPYVPDKLLKGTVNPSMTITPDPSAPGKADIKIGIDVPGLGTVGPSIPASIENGTLTADTSGLPAALKDPIDSAVKNLNDWFKSKGKGLAPPAFGKGQVSLSKVDLPAPAKTTPEPTPVPGPDIQKPTPPPPPPPVVPPQPQAAGTDWGHLAPTPDQWDKALQEAKEQAPPQKPTGVQPPGPKPLVGAGGPGGPKAPVGLGGVALNYIIAGIVLAVLVAAGIIVFAGPTLGLFGSAPAGTPSATQVAATTPTPIPTPTPTPAPQVVRSSDGAVTLTIPYGSVAAGTNLTVTPLGQADAPPELAGVTFRGFFYRVGPADATLTGPVGYERIIDLTDLRIDPETQGYPLIQLAERTTSGQWSWLADQHKQVGGPDGMADETKPTQTATLTTVGDVFGFSRGIYLHREPYPEAGTTFAVGAPIRIGATITTSNGQVVPTDFRPIVANALPTVGLSAPGVVYSDPLVLDDPTQQSAAITATCTQPGDFVVGLQLDVTPAAVASDSLIAQLGLGTAPTSTVAWTTSVHCGTETGGFNPTLEAGCVSVVHQRLSSRYPSYLVWTFRFDAATVPPGAVLILAFREEGLPDESYEVPMVDGRATLQTGITKYGLKVFEPLGVRVGAAGAVGTVVYEIEEFRDIFGVSATVTEKEGPLVGNDCL